MRLRDLCYPLLVAGCASAAPAGSPPVTDIHANDNRHPAGVLRHGVLSLDLELRRGRWHPDADDGPSIDVLAFGEAGRPLQIPSPLIRVREGTALRIRVRNTLGDSTVVVHGLHAGFGSGDDTVTVRPGAIRDVQFTAGAPGTYYYSASTSAKPVPDRDGDDSQLSGALIIDPKAGSPPDRVFVIGVWFHPGDSTARPIRTPQEVMAINGKAWPHTERFTPATGDTVRWRWINASAASHPMHLHGFYFDVESRGDGIRDTAYAEDDQLREVTELMLPGGTMAMRWTPVRPGNWLFHCHFAFHVSPFVSLTSAAAAKAGVHEHHPEKAMSGLVLGISVPPGPPATAAAPSAEAPREIRLLAQSAPKRFGDSTGYGFVVQRDAEPARDSIEIPGPPLVLERGRPVRITVVNHLAEPTGVHWHGIELESFPDGVPGWSGIAPRVMPAIAPGDSFVAEFTPPRAGTFIYHAHANEIEQLARGLYGALLVVEPGTMIDPAVDHLVLASLDGPSSDSSGGFVNGGKRPAPIELAAGRENRIRLINIDADHRVLFTLARAPDTTPSTWRGLAKDGAELPPRQATVRTARVMTGPGETADFGVTAALGDSLTLIVAAPFTNPAWRIVVPVRVKAAGLSVPGFAGQ